MKQTRSSIAQLSRQGIGWSSQPTENWPPPFPVRSVTHLSGLDTTNRPSPQGGGERAVCAATSHTIIRRPLRAAASRNCSLPPAGYGMHTSDSLFVASGVKSVSHQSHLDRMWQLVIAHRGCLDKPLKKRRFFRCVNPLALRGGVGGGGSTRSESRSMATSSP